MGSLMQKLKTLVGRKSGEGLENWERAWLQGRDFSFLGDTISEPYKQHETVFMALDALASVLPQVTLKLYANKTDKEILEGSVYDLFNTPNANECSFYLWEATVLFLTYYGNAFWMFGQSVGQAAGISKLPAEIHVCSPVHFTPIKKDGFLQGYQYGNKSYAPDALMHYKKFNMFDPFWGFCSKDVMKRTVNIDYKASIYQESFFDNAASIGGVISTDKSLTKKQRDDLLKYLQQRHQGVKKAGRLEVFEGGLKFTPGTESHKDMEYLEGRRWNRETILGLFRVPKSLFSITEDLNYATALEQKKLFWHSTIFPVLRYIEAKLNSNFFPRYAPELYCKFDYSGVIELQEDFHKQAETAVKLASIGFTGNEINKRMNLGFEEKPWRNEWWVPFGMVPASQAQEPTLPPTETDKPPKDKPKEEDDYEDVDPKEKVVSVFVLQKRRELTQSLFNQRMTSIEVRYSEKLKKFFYNMRVDVLRTLQKQFSPMNTKSLEDMIHMEWSDYDAELQALSVPYYAESISTGATLAARSLGKEVPETFNSLAIDYARNRVSRIKVVNQYTRSRIQNIIQDAQVQAIKDGWTIEETAKYIQAETKNFFNFSTARALNVARTEVNGSANGGSFLYMKQAEVKKKEWLTAGDEYVRNGPEPKYADHRKLHGTIIPIDQKFSNGLQFPGDNSAGKAKECVNCRCVNVAAV